MSELARTQTAWAAYLRAPTQTPLPEGTSAVRMQRYAQLLNNNISGFNRSITSKPSHSNTGIC